MIRVNQSNSHPFRCDPPVVLIAEAVLLLAFSLSLYRFAIAQNIWIDETTQLSGITLKFGDMLRWLSGEDAQRFGVPGDRMPPVSYILDWTWLRLFGGSELGFRLFHATILLIGVALLFSTARRNSNWPASFLVLAMLCISPKMIGTAVEIRAYPIFFTVAAAQTALFLRIIRDKNSIDKRLLSFFSVTCVVAIYTHFFGLVSTIAFFSGLGLFYLFQPMVLLEISLALVVIAAASVGILPFVLSAVSSSAAPDTEAIGNGHQYIVYLFKLFGESANMVSRSAAALFFGGAIILFFMSATAATKRMLDGSAKSPDWLLIVIIVGGSITLGARVFVNTFDVLKSSYSIWLFSPLVLFLVSGAIGSDRTRSWTGIYAVAAIAAIAGALLATYTFLFHASEFVHGPERFVNSLYDSIEPPKAVVYESGAAWEWSYFPLTFAHRGEIPQYRSARDDKVVRILPGSIQAGPETIALALAPYQDLLLVDIRLRTYTDIRHCFENRCPGFTSGPIADALLASGNWRRTSETRTFGLYDAQVQVFRREQ